MVLLIIRQQLGMGNVDGTSARNGAADNRMTACLGQCRWCVLDRLYMSGAVAVDEAIDIDVVVVMDGTIAIDVTLAISEAMTMGGAVAVGENHGYQLSSCDG